MVKQKIYLIAMLPIILLAACHNEPKVEGNNIVRVYNSVLNHSDMKNVVPPGYSAEDSAEISNNYIKKWVKQELLYYYALENLNDTEEISRRVKDYEKALYCHKIEEQYLQEHLDTLVPVEEIEAYYNQNLSEYKLKQAAVKAHYMIMDVGIPSFYIEYDKVIRSKPDKMTDLYELIKNTDKKIVEHFDWIYLDDLLSEVKTDLTPQIDYGIQVKYFYTEDETNRFLVKIDEIKEIGDTVPLNLVQAEINEIIINQRKEDLVTNLLNNLNRDATNKQNIIYKEN